MESHKQPHTISLHEVITDDQQMMIRHYLSLSGPGDHAVILQLLRQYPAGNPFGQRPVFIRA